MSDTNTPRGTVLVTGGSGFIAAHCILQLLDLGYRVRTTVRSLSRETEVRKMLSTGGAEPGETLSFFAADLNHDSGWREAVAHGDHVLHVASPFPAETPKDEDELIRPAVAGLAGAAVWVGQSVDRGTGPEPEQGAQSEP